MKKTVLFAALVNCYLVVNSCGVLFGGSKYEANITVKDHPNADIYVKNIKIGTGVANGKFPRQQALEVEVKEEGCESQIQKFDKNLRVGNFILSTISWGIIGIAVDLGTGAAYKPAHNTDPSIQRITDKKYDFTVNYSKCQKP